MTLNREQYIWLEQRNRDEDDVKEDKNGLYILMNNRWGKEVEKVYLLVDLKQ